MVESGDCSMWELFGQRRNVKFCNCVAFRNVSLFSGGGGHYFGGEGHTFFPLVLGPGEGHNFCQGFLVGGS